MLGTVQAKSSASISASVGGRLLTTLRSSPLEAMSIARLDQHAARDLFVLKRWFCDGRPGGQHTEVFPGMKDLEGLNVVVRRDQNLGKNFSHCARRGFIHRTIERDNPPNAETGSVASALRYASAA